MGRPVQGRLLLLPLLRFLLSSLLRLNLINLSKVSIRVSIINNNLSKSRGACRSPRIRLVFLRGFRIRRVRDRARLLVRLEEVLVVTREREGRVLAKAVAAVKVARSGDALVSYSHPGKVSWAS